MLVTTSKTERFPDWIWFAAGTFFLFQKRMRKSTRYFWTCCWIPSGQKNLVSMRGTRRFYDADSACKKNVSPSGIAMEGSRVACPKGAPLGRRETTTATLTSTLTISASTIPQKGTYMCQPYICQHCCCAPPTQAFPSAVSLYLRVPFIS